MNKNLNDIKMNSKRYMICILINFCKLKEFGLICEIMNH